MRLACLYVPRFPVAARLRAEPELCGAPLVVTDGKGPRAHVVALSAEAAQCGVTLGLSAAQAIAIEAALVCRAACPDVERAAQAALCEVAHSFSPRVEDAGDGMVYLGCDGLEALYGTETDLGRNLVDVAMRLGLDVRVGIASTRVVARLAAREGGGMTVIPRDEEWRFLAPLPVEVLEPSPAIRQRLVRWGIRSLGDLIALPASALSTRLGPDGMRLVRRARGEDERPLVSRPAPIRFEESGDFDHGIETLEALGFVLRGLLDRLTARLTLCGFVCGDLRLALRLTNHAHDERTVTVAVPNNDIKALLALVRQQLEVRPPAAPVETVRLAANPERLRARQLDLFRPDGPAPRQLALTLARLATLCGADRIGVPAVPDSHRPDAYEQIPVSGFRATHFSTLSAGGQGGGERGTHARLPALALRAVRPPRPLEVFTDRGRPDFVRLLALPGVSEPSAPSASGSAAPKRPDCNCACTGRVVTAAGPWRTEGSWWDAEAFSRDYYDVQLSDGGIYRVFYDAAQEEWFVDGIYD